MSWNDEKRFCEVFVLKKIFFGEMEGDSPVSAALEKVVDGLSGTTQGGRLGAMKALSKALVLLEGHELCLAATNHHALAKRCLYRLRTYDYIPFERIAYQNAMFQINGLPSLTLLFHARDFGGEKRAGLLWLKEDKLFSAADPAMIVCSSFLLLQMVHRCIFWVDESEGGSCSAIKPNLELVRALRAEVQVRAGIEVTEDELLDFLMKACLSQIPIQIE